MNRDPVFSVSSSRFCSSGCASAWLVLEPGCREGQCHTPGSATLQAVPPCLRVTENTAFPTRSEAWHWLLCTLDLLCLNAKSTGEFNSSFDKAWMTGCNNILSIIHQVANYGKLSSIISQKEIYSKLSACIYKIKRCFFIKPMALHFCFKLNWNRRSAEWFVLI